MMNIEDILSNPKIKEVIEKRNLSEDDIKINYPLFLEYYLSYKNHADSKSFCSANPDSDFIVLNTDPSLPVAQVKNCRQEFDIKKANDSSKNYIWDDFSTNTYKKLKSSDISRDGNKNQIAKELISRINSFNSGNDDKGMFVYGEPGVGKTFLNAVLSNYLSEKYEIAHIFFPKFVMRMKQFDNNSEENFRKKFESISKAKFLIIDDLGAENISQWSSSEILLNLLQSRQEDHLFTIINSNYSPYQLSAKYREKLKDTIAAKRIVKRIEQITTPVEME